MAALPVYAAANGTAPENLVFLNYIWKNLIFYFIFRYLNADLVALKTSGKQSFSINF